jgi:predicted metal-dependent hydrolase
MECGLSLMSQKSAKISAVIEPFRGYTLAPLYLGYFDCFNRQLFFEAHEVLEELWLPERGGPKDHFYKGLIQLAGAFVHLQKKRPGPAAALFKLAQVNLGKYPTRYEALEVVEVQRMISEWLASIEHGAVGLDGMGKLGFPKLSVNAGMIDADAERLSAR